MQNILNMENKLKEQLRFKMLGQLSDERTKEDINNAYDVAVDFFLSFLTFLRENYSTQKRLRRSDLEDNMWRLINTDSEYTTEEVLNKFLEEYESTK